MSRFRFINPNEIHEYAPRTEEEERLLEKLNNAICREHSQEACNMLYREYKYNIQRLRELHKKEEYLRNMERMGNLHPSHVLNTEYLALDEPPKKKSKSGEASSPSKLLLLEDEG